MWKQNQNRRMILEFANSRMLPTCSPLLLPQQTRPLHSEPQELRHNQPLRASEYPAPGLKGQRKSRNGVDLLVEGD